MNAVEYLKTIEWSMGDGQCPECCGVPADWYGHPGYRHPELIGHNVNCKLAQGIPGAIYKGTFKGENGFADMYKEGTVRGQAATAFVEWSIRTFDDVLYKALCDVSPVPK